MKVVPNKKLVFKIMKNLVKIQELNDLRVSFSHNLKLDIMSISIMTNGQNTFYYYRGKFIDSSNETSLKEVLQELKGIYSHLKGN